MIGGDLGVAGDRFFDRDVPRLQLRRQGDKFSGVAELVRPDDPQPPLGMRRFHLAQARTRRSNPFFGWMRPSDKTTRPAAVPEIECLPQFGKVNSIGNDGDRIIEAEVANFVVLLFAGRMNARRHGEPLRPGAKPRRRAS